jgi:hypothetical protein
MGSHCAGIALVGQSGAERGDRTSFEWEKGGARCRGSNYGTTRSFGFERGSYFLRGGMGGLAPGTRTGKSLMGMGACFE